VGFPDLSAALGAEKTTAEVQARLAAMRAQRPFLILRDSDRRQRIVPLAGGRFVLGRAADADLCLAWDPTVSAVHASLFERGGQRWAIDDDGLARNGTFVNGERLHGRHPLANGDVVRLGGTSIGFVDPRPSTVVATMAIDDHPKPTVSAAQRRVLVALCRPFKGGARAPSPASNQEIAEDLHVSVETVKTHLGNLYDLFGLGRLKPNEKRAQLAWHALESGVVDDVALSRDRD
jgi:pSer/pThr/pTyr-binding forkhead associated (FHA) protein